MKIILFCAAFVIGIAPALGITPVNSQCDFYDDYSTSRGWTQIGTDVQVSNGKVEFLNGAIDGERGDGQKRVSRNIGLTLNSNDAWTAEFEFSPESVGTNRGNPWTGHTLLALTAGTQEPFNDCTNLACTGFPVGTQDGIMVVYSANNPSDGDVFFKIRAKDGTSELASAPIIANTLGVTYFPRLERTSSTNVKLSVYSDAARTVPVGSPVNLAIPATITGLTTVQHGNIARGNFQRALTGSIDNLCIKIDSITRAPFDIKTKPVKKRVLSY